MPSEIFAISYSLSLLKHCTYCLRRCIDKLRLCLSDRSQLRSRLRGSQPSCWNNVLKEYEEVRRGNEEGANPKRSSREMSVRECHCCFCYCCCCRWCFSWCCSYCSCFVAVFPVAVLNIDDLICQAGSLWPRMATVWKGSNPNSISPFPTAHTFGFILSFFFLI